MKNLTLALLLIPTLSFAQVKSSGKSTKSPWGGTWWAMHAGQLALGWRNNEGRTWREKEEALAFDKCLVDTSKACTKLISELVKEKGISASPMMKFDLWVKSQVDKVYGLGKWPTMYSRATKNELDIHYIDNNPNHRHFEASGYAGKCTGWALSNLDYPEPTKTKTIDGVTFTPTDIKGILAAIYNGAQFFVPDELVLGNAYRLSSPDNNSKFKADPLPHDLIKALETHIKKNKKMIIADMDPLEGVWNHPLYQYDLALKAPKSGKVSGELVVYYADDQVGIDEVFTGGVRTDLISRSLTFELSVPARWDKKMESVISSKWTGESVYKHPDSLILGLEKDWRKSIYEYKNTNINKEVNFQLIKKVNLGDGYVVIVDELLKKYYSK